MTGKEREVFRQFISNRGYDVRDTNILIDEFQAFLVHTPDGRAFSAKLVGIAEKKLKHLRAIFVQGLSADSIQLSVPFRLVRLANHSLKLRRWCLVGQVL